MRSAAKQDLAAGRSQQPGQHPHRSALPRTVRPQVTKDIAGADIETDVIDSRTPGIDFGEVYGLQNRGMG